MGGIARAVPFRCQAKPPPSRGKGSSVVRAAAYNARDRLAIEQTGERADYRRGHSECTFSGIFAPKDAPKWLQVTKGTTREELSEIRQRLWNEVEQVEDRVNSQFARSIEFNLPHQLTQEQREQVAKDWVKHCFVRNGMIADVNLHAPHNDGDQRNHHGHLLLTLRRLDRDGWASTKEREWNSRALFQEWKIDLAKRCADRLEREGFKAEAARWRHGYMTLPQQRAKALERGDLEYAQACNRKPERHLGPQIKEMEKRGVKSYVEEQRAKEAAELDALQREIERLKAQREAIEREQKALQDQLRQRRPEPGRDQPSAFEREGAAGQDNPREQTEYREKQKRSHTHDRTAETEPPLYSPVGDIRIAYQVSDSADQFVDALRHRGFYLARADESDVKHALEQHFKAEGEGRYSAPLDLGQYVVVDERGRVFALNRSSTGETRPEVLAFLSPFDGKDVPSVDDTRHVNSTIREVRYHYNGRYVHNEAPKEATKEAPPSDLHRPAVLDRAGTALEYAAMGVEKVLEFGAGAVETALGFADGFVAPSPPTRQQIFAKTRETARAQTRAGIDFARYQNDGDYRRQVLAQQRAEQERREQGRYHQRQKEADRGRD